MNQGMLLQQLQPKYGEISGQPIQLQLNHISKYRKFHHFIVAPIGAQKVSLTHHKIFNSI